MLQKSYGTSVLPVEAGLCTVFYCTFLEKLLFLTQLTHFIVYFYFLSELPIWRLTPATRNIFDVWLDHGDHLHHANNHRVFLWTLLYEINRSKKWKQAVPVFFHHIYWCFGKQSIKSILKISTLPIGLFWGSCVFTGWLFHVLAASLCQCCLFNNVLLIQQDGLQVPDGGWDDWVIHVVHTKHAVEAKYFCAVTVDWRPTGIINFLLRLRQSRPDEPLSIEILARFHSNLAAFWKDDWTFL